MIDLQKKIIAHLEAGPASKLGLRMALMCRSDDLEAAMDKLESVDVIESKLVGNKYLYSNVRHVPAAEKKEEITVAKTIKEQILDLLREQPNKPLKASDVIGLLPTANKGTIKAVIYKMAEVGELVKKGHFFLLPGGTVVADKTDASPAAVDLPEPEVVQKVEDATASIKDDPLFGTSVPFIQEPVIKKVDASINMAGIVSITTGLGRIELTKAEFQRVAEFVGGAGV